jgi:hypothetical protein
MSYEPAPVPRDDQSLREYLARELRRLANDLRTVVYQASPVVASLSAGISANWKVPAGFLLMSTSNTITLTGIADQRAHTFVNIGSGVVVFKSQGTESSASNRFALVTDYAISANGTLSTWYDPAAFRHRGLSKT